ncbi:MAG: fasciclin domain-containing protein [Bacteroidales bacterium]|nr:fasciclin domain-containing protein [Bacteroidales bacterium]
MKRLLFGAIALLMMCTACKDFRLQTDYKYESSPLDPHIGINAWEFMQTRDDLTEMVEAVEYTGMVDYYTQADRTITYLFLNNTAMLAFRNNHAQVDKVSYCDKEEVTRLLLYHMIVGEYHSLNQKLPVEPIYVKTLLEGEWGLMTLKVNKSSTNSIGYPIANGNIVANEKGSNFNSRRSSSIASNIMPTNGVIHIMNDYAMFRKTYTDVTPY